MQIETQDYLNMVESAGKLAVWDTEATGLNGDYNSVLCVSVKTFGGGVKTFSTRKPGDDKAVVAAAADYLSHFHCWVTYYGKGFDVKMLRARLLYHGLPDLTSRHHIDMFFTLMAMKTSRHSQAHLLSWLGCEEQKMGVPAGEWSAVLANPRKVMPVMVARCESDCRGLEALYKRARHIIKDVKRG